MRNCFTPLVLTLAALILGFQPVSAQTSDPLPTPEGEESTEVLENSDGSDRQSVSFPSSSTSIAANIEKIIALNRAKNYARQAAEAANGGLSQYRAEAAMHGPGSESPYLDQGDGTFTFTFFGGEPGFTEPTVESVVTVAAEADVVTVDYNGPVRPETLAARERAAQAQGGSDMRLSSGAGSDTAFGLDPELLADLRKAKNYARQTAEAANGGLNQYQTETAMHGPSVLTPYTENSDGTLTFIVLGGEPGFVTPSTESVVTVNPETWAVNLDYNGAIRPQTRAARDSDIQGPTEGQDNRGDRPDNINTPARPTP